MLSLVFWSYRFVVMCLYLVCFLQISRV